MIKIFLPLIAMTLFTSAAAAQTATGTGNANSSSNSGAVAIGGGGGTARAGGGNAQVIFNTPGSTRSDNTNRIRQSGSLKTTPNAIAPGLGSAAIETCYGPGVSAGLSVTGFGGSFGAGQYDAACNRRLNARTLFAMGYKQQAINVLMGEPEVAAAFGYGPQAGRPVAYAPAARQVVVEREAYAPMAVVGDGGPGTASRGQRYSSCKKWSGGAVGVGHCLY